MKLSWFKWVNLVTLFVVAVIALNVGASEITQIWQILFHPNATGNDAIIIWQIRIPRIVTAIIVGAALGAAGAIAQGATGNPLSEPTTLGTAAGASLAVVLGVLLNLVAIGSIGAMALATIGALLITLLVLRLASRNRKVTPLDLIIIGLALAATISALVGLLTSAITRADARSVSFWSLGSLALTNRNDIFPLLLAVSIGLTIAFWISPKLDLLSLGDATSRHLGVDPKATRRFSLFALSLLTGAAVSTVGTISFLGLAAPHIVRLRIGPRHRPLVIQSAILGATILLSADTLARTIAAPNELAVGLFTALIGAPILVALVRVRRVTEFTDD